MQLSVVIICWNSLPYLREMLASLRDALCAAGKSEIILIDNGSTDGTDQYIARHYPNIVYRRLPCNRGVSYARNRGWELARGEYIWQLDDDTIVNAPALQAMLDYMHEHHDCGICSCRLVNAAGETQLSYKAYPGIGVKISNILRSFVCPSRHADPYAAQMAAGLPFEPVYVIGACQLIRRSVIDRVGLLDEHIFYGPEDADFCLRAHHAGWHIAYLPGVSLMHHWKRITNRNPFTPIARKHIAALIYFYHKHHRLC